MKNDKKKNNNDVDEAIVQALQFANLVTLQRSFQLINWGQFQPHVTSIIGGMNEGNKEKTKTKGKRFQKVALSTTKSKSNTIKGEGQQSQLHMRSGNLVLDDYISSRYENTFQPQYQNLLINNSLISNQTPTLHHSKQINFYNYQSSSLFMQESQMQNSYSMNDFLKQTSVSLSRNNQSPIMAWNGNKVSSAEKGSGERGSPGKRSIGKDKALSANRTVSAFSIGSDSKKAKSKFEKAKVPNTKTINSTPINTSPLAINKVTVATSTPFKPLSFMQPISSQHSRNNNSQESQDFDASTRATCQLAPSKLEKLIEVQDNKYKQIVLKTYFKHQK